MEIEIKGESRAFEEGGVTLLCASYDVPQLEGKNAKRAQKYFSEINEIYLHTIEKSLFARLRGEYIQDTSATKKFTYRRVDFSHKIALMLDGKKCFSLTRTLEIKRRGKTLMYRISGDVISKKTGRLVPINAFISRLRLWENARKIKKAVGARVKYYSYYLDREGALVLIFSDGARLYECDKDGKILKRHNMGVR